MHRRPAKIGVVGAGRMGQLHIQKAKQCPDVDFVGFYDHRQEIEGSVSSLEDLLKNAEAVVVATSTASHFAVADAALDSGCAVLLEKPMTGDSHLAEQLLQKAKESRLVLSFGLLEKIRRKAMWTSIADVRHLEARRWSLAPGREPEISVLEDLMIHDIDLILHLVGESPLRMNVSGEKVGTTTWDRVCVQFEFPSGATARCYGDRFAEQRMRSLHVEALKGKLHFDFDTNRIQGAVDGPRVEKTISEIDPLALQLSGFVESLAAPPNYRETEQSLNALKAVESLLAQLEEDPQKIPPRPWPTQPEVAEWV